MNSCIILFFPLCFSSCPRTVRPLLTHAPLAPCRTTRRSTFPLAPRCHRSPVLHGASDLGREANLWSLSEPKLEQSGNSYEISRSLKSTTKSVRFSNGDGGGGGRGRGQGQGERGASGGMVVEEVGAHCVHGWQGG
ncbi:unnamed protein product, partial [Musa acuminata subsp. burmannicoides]